MIPSVNKDAELLEFSFIAGDSIATLENSSAVFYKIVSTHLPYNPTISFHS